MWNQTTQMFFENIFHKSGSIDSKLVQWVRVSMFGSHSIIGAICPYQISVLHVRTH